MTRAAHRTLFQMVPEDDAQWLRFWAAFPQHIAKQAARKAWADLAPSVDLVDRMIEALTWQSALWARQGYGTPYPASWIRAERWTDEQPINGHGRSAPVYDPWVCPHVESCLHQAMCRLKDAMPHKYQRKGDAS